MILQCHNINNNNDSNNGKNKYTTDKRQCAVSPENYLSKLHYLVYLLPVD